jgi:hypothetical protein
MAMLRLAQSSMLWKNHTKDQGTMFDYAMLVFAA